MSKQLGARGNDQDRSLEQAQNAVSERKVFGRFTAEAREFLASISTGDAPLKRRTIIALGRAEWTHESIRSVLGEEHTGSSAAHYRWLQEDPAYQAAYRFLIGTAESPGYVLKVRDQHYAEMEMLAIQQIEKGRLDIKTAVPEAVKTLVAGLQATDRRGPDWRSRLEAANSIIRLATEQTGSTTQNLTVITAHTQIGKIYNEGTENSLLAAGEGSDLAQESPIIDGEFSETSSETTAENPSAATNEGRTTPSRPPAPLVNNGRTQEGSSHEKDATAQGLLTSLQQAPVLQELDESQRTAVLQLLNKYTTGHTTTNEPELELEEPHTEKKTSTPSRKES